MLKFLFFVAGAYILWKMFAGDMNHRKEESKKEREVLIAKGEMVKDPVCGSYVALDDSVRLREGDEVLHFCSYECRDKYVKELQSSKNKEG